MTAVAVAAAAVAAAAAATVKEDHVILFPFLSKGHTIPLLHLAAALSSRNILTSLITTPANLPFCRNYLSSNAATATVDLLAIPFPLHPDLPAGVESTDSLPTFSLLPTFIKATNSLHDPFLRLLRRLLLSSTPPLCLISDYFLGWTLPISSRFGLPRLVFHGSSTFSISLIKSLSLDIPAVCAADDHTFPIVGAPPALRLTVADVPEFVRQLVNPLDPLTQSMKSIEEMDVGSWGVIVNSFAELEPLAYVKLLESFYEPVAGGRAWLIGPLSLITGTEPVDSECIRWLDRQPVGSVVYVAFGTQADVSDEQLDELAHGLMQARVRFLWVVRSKRWVAPKGLEDLGRIERAWVPQKDVLNHVAVGGFVSHCGWNSVLEAVSAGVAVLTWPMIAEQCLNAKMVAEEIGVGIRLRLPMTGGVVGRKEVEEAVRELMEGEKGRRARERVAKLAEKAKTAVEGGSSYQTLERLLQELRKVPKAVAMMEVDEREGQVNPCNFKFKP